MSSFESILKTPGALAILLAALFLAIAQIAALLLSPRKKGSGRQMAAAALHLLAGFAFFVTVLEIYDIVNFPQIRREAVIGWSILPSLPWLCYVFPEAVSAAVLALQFRAYRRYRTGTVTPDAIRQTVDRLPEGICVSDADGTVLLANLKMIALCRELTGETLSNAAVFRSALKAAGEDQGGKRLVLTPQGEAWLFSKGTIAADGRDYDRTSAVNVTERYRMTEELREKNAHLLDIQRRMKEAAELSAEMFVKQEETTARTVLHNELGQVLLMGRHYIEHPDSTDASMVALMTKQMNAFLLGETGALGPETGDELQQAVDIAGSIGVKVELRGDPPKEGRPRALLAAAIRECAANAVKHAEGDRLEVVLREEPAAPSAGQSAAGAEPKRLVITVTNNGRPPKGPIAESGGLLSLRRGVEAAGGEMTVESVPNFALILVFPDV